MLPDPLAAKVLLVALLFSGSCHAQLEIGSLDRHSYADWRRAVLPAPGEARWESIPWLTTYADGIRESARQGKPLLLWGMNGHPLGCT